VLNGRSLADKRCPGYIAWKRSTFVQSLDNETKKWMTPAKHLPAGNNLEWPTWRAFNRLRVGVGRSKENLAKWGIISEEDTSCDCGQLQTMSHLLRCPSCLTSCTIDNGRHHVSDKGRNRFGQVLAR